MLWWTRAITTSRDAPSLVDRSYMLPSVAMYFAYFYDLADVYHMPTSDASFGAYLDVDARALYVSCDEYLLTRALFCAETIPAERVMVSTTTVSTARSTVACTRCWR